MDLDPSNRSKRQLEEKYKAEEQIVGEVRMWTR